MGRERWGTFSVRDHTVEHPFAADVLMYDRLVIPRPGDETERKKWVKQKWAPKRLDSILQVLRADEPDGRAITVAWTEQASDLCKRRAEMAAIVDQEANYGLTRRLLATELLPPEPKGVSRVAVVAAYPSVAAAGRDWISNGAQAKRETLTAALSHQLLVPKAKGRSDLEVLKRAVDLADDADFREKRGQMYQWQDEIIRNGISDSHALQEMADYVADYNKATKKAVRDVYAKFAFTLVPIGLSAVAGPLAPAVAAGGVANLVRFWIFDRTPVVRAGKSEAAAMFHTIQQRLGWRMRPAEA